MGWSRSYFTKGLLAAVALIIFSFISYFISSLSEVIFILVTLIFLVITTRDLFLAILVLFAELLIGGHGYMIRLPINDFYISIRHIWFAIILFVFIVTLRGALPHLWKTRTLILDLIIGAVFVTLYGAALGILRGNGLMNVFLDANAFAFLFIFFPIAYLAEREERFNERFFSFLLGSGTVLAILTLVTFYLFSIGSSIAPSWYLWVRDVRIGEITDTGYLFRIFFQSHLFLLLSLLFFVVTLLLRVTRGHFTRYLFFFTLTVLMLSSLLVGMSRSFAIGFAAGIFAVLIVGLSAKRVTLRSIVNAFGIGALALFFAVILIGVLSGNLLNVTHLKERFTVSDEPAVDSRWLLLKPLAEEIQNNFIFGEGFGTAIRYTTKDPRIVSATNGAGVYETYSFEWGFLDLWLKTGIFGLFVWFFLLYAICKSAYRRLMSGGGSLEALFSLGIVVTLAVVHFFTPYLNHPLGIGAISLASALTMRRAFHQ